MEEVEELNKKILNLSLNCQLDDSFNLLEILFLEIKLCKLQIENLDKMKPFWFQKKKLETYTKKRKELLDLLSKYQQSLEVELKLMSKLSDN